jgi:hypothetical protein
MWCPDATFFLFFYAAMTCTELPPTDSKQFCKIAKPISWVSADSRLTKEEIDEHNRVGKRLCGWKGSKKK